MKPKAKSVTAQKEEQNSPAGMAWLGAFLGLALLKFGNPPIMEKWVSPPNDIFEFILGNPWPIAWAYILLGVVAVISLIKTKPFSAAPRWLLILPAAWVLWEMIAGLGTISAELTRPVIGHFVACAVCFYLAVFCSSSHRSLLWVLPGLVCAFLIVVAVGWEQHFGGLEQTRKYFFMYLYPKLKEVPPEYIKKLSSPRIFSTMFYPNALAGAILLVLPPVLQFVWQARQRFTTGARAFLVSAIGLGALACLYWSGSKGGWLLTLLLVLIWILRLPFSLAIKRGLIAGLLVLGLIGFFWKYAGFFEKGATSVGARFDYWSAALKSSLAHPIAGTGPGTFPITYQKLKRPESEMSRLAHNDYLQQASDSGIPGFLLYTGCIAALLFVTRPSGGREAVRVAAPPVKRPRSPGVDAATEQRDRADLWFAIWLGALGWALQSFMEFSLYIPALAWTAFAFLGLLLQHRFQRHGTGCSASAAG